MIVEKDAQIPGAIRIRGNAGGPRAVLFAGVHGDEVSGVHAIEKLLFDFFVEARELQQGSLTLVRGNEQALSAERLRS
jgi:predicted deacylase